MKIDAQRFKTDVQYQRSCVEAAIKEVLAGFSPNSTDESELRPEESIILGRLVAEAQSRFDRVMGPNPPNLCRSYLSEGCNEAYLQRWNHHNPHQVGRGVSVRRNEVLVFTGKRSGIDYEYIDVTGIPGPWNADVRKMLASLKRYIGSDDAVCQAIKTPESWSPDLFRSIKNRETMSSRMRRASPSAGQLEQARAATLGTGAPEPSAAESDLMSWLPWAVGAVIVLALLRSCG